MLFLRKDTSVGPHDAQENFVYKKILQGTFFLISFLTVPQALWLSSLLIQETKCQWEKKQSLLKVYLVFLAFDPIT